MKNAKPWPSSESEFVMSPALVEELRLHRRVCRNVECFGQHLQAIERDVLARVTLDSLRGIAETYYIAAGFRE